MPGPSLSDLKTYLGLTTSGDNALLTSALAAGIAQAERDTGRTFSYSSNNTFDYSSDGQTLVSIDDVPRVDATRVITLSGVTLTEGTNAWFLPDRRNPDISTTLQLFAFDYGRADWYKSDPMWFDKNLDWTGSRRGNTPLDVRLAGFAGHPVWKADVTEQCLFLGAWFYWRAKSGASGVVQLPNGEEVDLGGEPRSTPQFIRNWAVRTAVAVGG